MIALCAVGVATLGWKENFDDLTNELTGVITGQKGKAFTCVADYSVLVHEGNPVRKDLEQAIPGEGVAFEKFPYVVLLKVRHGYNRLSRDLRGPTRGSSFP